MSRTFEERKPQKTVIKSEENKTIIRALNMYGRVPEIWELLNEIENLTNILIELEEWLKKEIEHNVDGIKSFSGYQCKETLDKIQELKEKYK